MTKFIKYNYSYVIITYTLFQKLLVMTVNKPPRRKTNQVGLLQSAMQIQLRFLWEGQAGVSGGR